MFKCLSLFLHKWNKPPTGKCWPFDHKSCLSLPEATLCEDVAKFLSESHVLTNGGGDIFSWRKLNLPSPSPSKWWALPLSNWLSWQSSIPEIRWCITVTYGMGFQELSSKLYTVAFHCWLGLLRACRWNMDRILLSRELFSQLPCWLRCVLN